MFPGPRASRPLLFRVRKTRAGETPAIPGALAAVVVATAAFLAAAPVRAAESTPFFAGKTVRILVGFSSGGGYDLYARELGRYLGRHIPGNPAVVVQNMAGAGSLKAGNFLYKE